MASRGLLVEERLGGLTGHMVTIRATKVTPLWQVCVDTSCGRRYAVAAGATLSVANILPTASLSMHRQPADRLTVARRSAMHAQTSPYVRVVRAVP